VTSHLKRLELCEKILFEYVFWDVAPCSLTGIYRCFKGTYCIHHQGDGGNRHLSNVGREPGSSVSIVSGYGLDDREIDV
jgi:hypothetical protein